MKTTQQLLEKFYTVYSPSDVIEYWKQGLWETEYALEKLEGFVERHECKKSQDSGCPCDAWLGIINAINETCDHEWDIDDCGDQSDGGGYVAYEYCRKCGIKSGK